MVKTLVSRSIEIDYGHTLPNHFSFCNQIHGHRAKIVICVEGDICKIKGASEEGMVFDFKILKDLLIEVVHNRLDHGFAVWKKDLKDLDFIQHRNKRCLITEEPPTAECLAEWAFTELVARLPPKITLVRVEWHETPSSIAIFENKQRN